MRPDIGQDDRLAVDLELKSIIQPGDQDRTTGFVDDRLGLTNLHALHVEAGIAAAYPVNSRALVRRGARDDDLHFPEYLVLRHSCRGKDQTSGQSQQSQYSHHFRTPFACCYCSSDARNGGFVAGEINEDTAAAAG